MKKFKIKIKSVQEAELLLPAEAYGSEDVTAEEIAEMEETNVKSDPSYFNFLEGATEKVTVEVTEVKDA